MIHFNFDTKKIIPNVSNCKKYSWNRCIDKYIESISKKYFKSSNSCSKMVLANEAFENSIIYNLYTDTKNYKYLFNILSFVNTVQESINTVLHSSSRGNFKGQVLINNFEEYLPDEKSINTFSILLNNRFANAGYKFNIDMTRFNDKVVSITITIDWNEPFKRE